MGAATAIRGADLIADGDVCFRLWFEMVHKMSDGVSQGYGAAEKRMSTLGVGLGIGTDGCAREWESQEDAALLPFRGCLRAVL